MIHVGLHCSAGSRGHPHGLRGFTAAETVAYDDLLKAGSIAAAREAGAVSQEGKEYVVKDGDVLLFKFNV